MAMPIWFWDELMEYRWTRRIVLGAVASLLVVFGDIGARGTILGLGAIAAFLIVCEFLDRFFRQGDHIL